MSCLHFMLKLQNLPRNLVISCVNSRLKYKLLVKKIKKKFYLKTNVRLKFISLTTHDI